MEASIVSKLLNIHENMYEDLTDEILHLSNNSAYSLLDDVISHLPFISSQLSEYFIYLSNRFPEFIEIISKIIFTESNDESVEFSKFILAKNLGFQCNNTEKNTVYNKFSLKNKDFPFFKNNPIIL